MKNIYYRIKLFLISAWVFLALLMAGNVFAQDYSSSDNMRFEVTMEPGNFLYVDDDNATGPWTGSQANPFQNIPEALDAAVPGVTVVVLPGNYPINQNISVAADIKLFLYQGDTLLFGENYGLEIIGILKAIGTVADSIYFTSSIAENSWTGIHFINSQQGSEMRFCTIENGAGTDGDKGGGMYISNSSPWIFNSLIQHNNADYGAGIYCENNASPDIKNCRFYNNNANISGGGLYGFQTDSLVLHHNDFHENVAASNGGALMIKDARVIMLGCDFFNNQANNGGAACLEGVTANHEAFLFNSFKSNVASINGGAIYIVNSDEHKMSKNLFLYNTAVEGGGIYFDNADIDFSNNTIFGNTASSSGGGLSANGGNSNIFNNIFWGNNPDTSQVTGIGLNVNFNDIEGAYPGNGNFSSDPEFVSVLLNDFSLSVLSPCINTGDSLSPFDPDGTIADLGAYYFHHLPPQIMKQPVDEKIDDGEDAVFIIVSSPAMSFRWQESTDNGDTWSDLDDAGIYSGSSTYRLTIVDVNLDMHGYQYRCVVNGIGPPAIVSDAAVLKVYAIISIAAGSETICPGIVEIPITVVDFYRVSAMSLALNYNPLLIDYIGYFDLHEELEGSFLNVNAFEGKIYLSWISTNSVDVGDGTLIKFQFNSLKDGSANHTWDTITPGNCELAHLDGHIFKDNYYNGNTTVYLPPEITAHPSDRTVNFGQNATFSMNAVGSGVNYQWQESLDDGLNWNNLSNTAPYSGVTTKTLTIATPPVNMTNYMYRCYINGYCPPSDTTNEVTLNVNPVITTIAGSTTVCPDTAIIPISVQEFYNVAAFSLTLNFNALVVDFLDYQNLNVLLEPGNLYVNADNGQVKISWASIVPVNIGTAQTIELIFLSQGGTTGLTWDLQTPGACEYSDYYGTTILSNYSNGNITVYYPPQITSHPLDRSILAGQTTTFSISATGTGPTYRWQESPDDGNSWYDLNNGGHYANVTSHTLSLLNVPESFDGNLYRCRVSGTCPPSDISDHALLNVTYIPPPQVITTSVGTVPSACPGFVLVPIHVEDFEDVGAFSLTLSFDTSILSYVFYQNLNSGLSDGTFVASASEGKVYLSWASTTATSIGDDKIVDLLFVSESGNSNFTWDTSTPGNCEYSDINGGIILSNYTNGNILVYYPPQILSHPVDRDILAGQNTSFSVGATGTGLSYQWQESNDSGDAWENLSNVAPYSGVTSATMYLTSTPVELDGNLYRCVVGGTCTPATISDFALLTVTYIPPPQIIHTTVGSVASSCTGNIHLPVMVEDFNGVAAFSLTLYCNPGVLQFDSYQLLHPALQSGQVLFNAVSGYIFMSWVSVSPVSIGNGTLFDLCFISQGGSTDLTWDLNTPGNCEYSDIYGSVIQSTYTNGNVSVVIDPLIADGGNDTIIDIGQSVTLNGSATGGLSPYNYLWSTGETGQSITVSPVSTTNYTFTAIDENACNAMDYVKVVVPPLPVVDTVNVPAGWSGISSYVVPDVPGVENIFQPYLSDLIILINPSGKFYWPDQDINTIINWNSHDGYMIKTTDETEILFTGIEETWKSVSVPGGWNLIPVLSKCDVDVVELFTGTDPVIVKEVAGWRVYWPQYNLNSLINLNSGEAYYVKMNTGATITYPECTPSLTVPLDWNGVYPPPPGGVRGGQLSPWQLSLPTTITHTIAIPLNAFDEMEIEEGNIIGAFDETGACYGVTAYENSNTSFTLFGDDPTTTIKDGFSEFEHIIFMRYVSGNHAQSDLIAEFDPSLPDNQGVFVVHGLSAINKFKEKPSSVTFLSEHWIEIFPNPTTGKLTISFNGIEGLVTLVVSNLHGEAISREDVFITLSNSILKKDLSGFPAGVFVFRFIYNETTIIKKVVVK
nr:T9SS type A sorting domain-containing protein [Bacteroidota bacterium]